MFFKKNHNKKLKLIIASSLMIVFFASNAEFSIAAQTMDVPELQSNSGWELQSSTDSWTEQKENVPGTPAMGTSNVDHNFDTAQYPEGLSTPILSTVLNNNLKYETRSSKQTGTAYSSGGLYYIGTGVMTGNGYSVTAVYDKGTYNDSATDDYLREVRVKAPDGSEKVYIWNGGNKSTTDKNGNILPGTTMGQSDQDILNEIGKANGINDLYSSIVNNSEADDEQSKEDIQAIMLKTVNSAYSQGFITSDEKNDLISKINSGATIDPNDETYKDLLARVNKSSNAVIPILDRYFRAAVFADNPDGLAVDANGNLTTTATYTQAQRDAKASEALRLNNAGTPGERATVGECFKWFTGIIVENCITRILYWILYLVSFVLGIAGFFFNSVFSITVFNMAANVNSIQIIPVGWTTIRDLANILFIFMLLYLAISTILQLDEHGVKQGLSRLIIGAVLINFSLFFVKIPIDISNIMATEIYKKINPDNSAFGIGDAVMSMFSPQQVFRDPNAGGVSNSDLDPRNISNFVNHEVAGKGQSWNLEAQPMTTFLMGIIIILTTLFIFLAVCIIFIKRFITLIMLMIFSPLAFAGMAVPNHNIEHEISQRFWGSLLKESFYAPVFLFMIYLTIKTGQGLNQTPLSGFLAGSSLADWGITLPVTNIISYSVVVGMLIFSLSISEVMGVKGAGAAMSAFDGMRGWTSGWVGKNTAGTLAYNLLEKHEFGTETLKQMRQGMLGGKLVSNPVLRGITRGLGNSITTGLGKAGEGHHHDIERDMAATKDTLNELRDDPEKQAALIGEMMKGDKKLGGLIHPYDQKVAKYVGTAMKDDEVATMVQFMKDAGKNDEAATLVNYLGKDRKRNVQDLIDNSATRYHKVKLGDYADGMRLADQWSNNNGVIDVDNGHGGTDHLSGDEAIKHMRDNYDAVDANGTVSKSRVEGKMTTMFDSFSEKQTTGILQSLSADQQNTLAAQPAFRDLARRKLTNFRMVESSMKNGMEKSLQDELSKIAYEGLSRYELASKLRVNRGDPILEAEWDSISGGVSFDDYESGQWSRVGPNGEQIGDKLNRRQDDETFKSADKNLTRFASRDLSYDQMKENTANQVTYAEQARSAAADIQTLQTQATQFAAQTQNATTAPAVQQALQQAQTLQALTTQTMQKTQVAYNAAQNALTVAANQVNQATAQVARMNQALQAAQTNGNQAAIHTAQAQVDKANEALQRAQATTTLMRTQQGNAQTTLTQTQQQAQVIQGQIAALNQQAAQLAAQPRPPRTPINLAP
ncbi:MAG: hypothetical protein V4509_02640 [Patescibacteria group bacterium]